MLGKALTLLGRELASDLPLGGRQDGLRFVEERLRPFEVSTRMGGQVGAKRGLGVLGERQLMTKRPNGHFEGREQHDADGNGLRAHDRLKPGEHARRLGAARGRQCPDYERRENDRKQREPKDPISEPQNPRALWRRRLVKRDCGRSYGRTGVQGEMRRAVGGRRTPGTLEIVAIARLLGLQGTSASATSSQSSTA